MNKLKKMFNKKKHITKNKKKNKMNLKIIKHLRKLTRL